LLFFDVSATTSDTFVLETWIATVPFVQGRVLAGCRVGVELKTKKRHFILRSLEWRRLTSHTGFKRCSLNAHVQDIVSWFAHIRMLWDALPIYFAFQQHRNELP
jgi:hypothetical protein